MATNYNERKANQKGGSSINRCQKCQSCKLCLSCGFCMKKKTCDDCGPQCP